MKTFRFRELQACLKKKKIPPKKITSRMLQSLSEKTLNFTLKQLELFHQITLIENIYIYCHLKFLSYIFQDWVITMTKTTFKQSCTTAAWGIWSPIFWKPENMAPAKTEVPRNFHATARHTKLYKVQGNKAHLTVGAINTVADKLSTVELGPTPAGPQSSSQPFKKERDRQQHKQETS